MATSVAPNDLPVIPVGSLTSLQSGDRWGLALVKLMGGAQSAPCDLCYLWYLEDGPLVLAKSAHHDRPMGKNLSLGKHGEIDWEIDRQK